MRHAGWMTTTASESPRPTEIKLRKADKTLTVSFESAEAFTLTAEYLRVESPSAEVQGHSPDQKVLVPGKRYVGIDTVEPVGHYAVRLLFNDGHDTGIYTWVYLYQLGREFDQRWERYLSQMDAQGLSRDLA
jgi:DUF971 family protein